MAEVPEVSETQCTETVIEYLNAALVDLKETGDYLSYATLLDVHLSDPERFSHDENVVILKELNKILSENPDVVYEIGWDLPELLLRYVDSEWDFEGRILDAAPLVRISMSCFQDLAKTGNAKELFIKTIELLSVFEFPGKDEERAVLLKRDRIVDIKTHILFELLSSSLKRINTIYPSKFLGMALGAILKFMGLYFKYSTYQRFLIRRAYVFARDYISPLKPLNYIESHGLTQEEAAKIDEDEKYLERVLLQSFITHIYGSSFNGNSLALSFKYYHNLQLTKKGLLPINYTDEISDTISSTYTVYLRLLTLAQSFDFEIPEEFAKLQDDSLKLFSKIDESKSNDDKIQDLLKYSVNDLISNMFHAESKTIPKSSLGLLIMSAHYSFEEQEFELSTHALVLSAIRFLSPGLLAEKFRSFATLDVLLYLHWRNITDESKAKEYATIPKYQIVLFLQIIIFYSSITNDPSVGLVSYTLLTRLLTLISEDSAYDFLIDSLATAPFQNAKMALISILKDLILRTRPDEAPSVDELTKALDSTKLDADDEKSGSPTPTPDTKETKSEPSEGKPPPSLPRRSFISLTDSRVEDIYALIRESIDETFPDVGKYEESSAKLTLGYLNLLIGLRKKVPVEKQKEVSKAVESKLIDEIEGGDNNLQMIKLAHESLASFLK